jgi:uncharacterized protein
VNNPSQDDVPAGQKPEADDTDKPETDQQEPSMEDILTSIRRILSEEGGEETEEPREDDAAEREIVLEDMEPTPAEPESDNVLVLTPQMRAPLVSATAATASADVLNQLAKAILDRRDLAIGNRDVTLEGMVREMMRPLLKEWLDRNLPYLIERLVKKEIDQMINRAERLED